MIHGRRLALDFSKEMVEGRADTQLCKKHTRYFVGASAHSVHKRTKILRSPDRLTKLLFEACGPCQTVVDVPRAPDTAIAARPAAWTVARALRLPLLALQTSITGSDFLRTFVAWTGLVAHLGSLRVL